MSAGAFGQAQRGTITVTVTDADGAAPSGRNGRGIVGSGPDPAHGRFGRHRQGEPGRSRSGGQLCSVGQPSTASPVQRIEGTAVRAGQDTPLAVQLTLAEISEELIVTAESPLVDVTKTQAGQDITLQLTESLPTARSYQSFLQLVPGVQDSLGETDNPASRSGINYRDADGSEGDVGRSTDNLYYFDGINVTDRTAGTNGANLNTEIIQEQSVLTGAIPAEFIGAPGLISNVVTKSGGNQFSGSVNYYLQDDSFVESNKHFADETFSTFDAAGTLGGPIWKDKAWFFASFRTIEEERDVADENGMFLRTAKDSSDQAFGKVTWSITDSDVFTGTFLTDPRDVSGNFDGSVPNTADTVDDRGGERFSASATTGSGVRPPSSSPTPIMKPISTRRRRISRRPTRSPSRRASFTSADERLGGGGTNFVEIPCHRVGARFARVPLRHQLGRSRPEVWRRRRRKHPVRERRDFRRPAGHLHLDQRPRHQWPDRALRDRGHLHRHAVVARRLRRLER